MMTSGIHACLVFGQLVYKHRQLHQTALFGVENKDYAESLKLIFVKAIRWIYTKSWSENMTFL